MATGQSLLDMMEIVNQELELQPGDPDVGRGLVSLNAAQDWFETLCAQEPNLFGDTIGTLSTTIAQERTPYPTGVMRLDALWALDSNGFPVRELDRIDRTGGHAWRRAWPWSIIGMTAPGLVNGYWTDGRFVYWQPLPSSNEDVRWYGFQSAADITTLGTFTYPDACVLPFATFAARILASGVGDESVDLQNLAASTFGPLMAQLSKFQRERAAQLEYRYYHDA